MDEFEKMIAEIRKEQALENHVHYSLGHCRVLDADELRKVARDALKKEQDYTIEPLILRSSMESMENVTDKVLEDMRNQLRKAHLIPVPFEAPDAVYVQSADEMFRGLGYKKVDDLDEDVVRYVNYPYEIRKIDGRVFKFHNGYGKDGLTDNEILACAQLIKEMSEHS